MSRTGLMNRAHVVSSLSPGVCVASSTQPNTALSVPARLLLPTASRSECARVPVSVFSSRVLKVAILPLHIFRWAMISQMTILITKVFENYNYYYKQPSNGLFFYKGVNLYKYMWSSEVEVEHIKGQKRETRKKEYRVLGRVQEGSPEKGRREMDVMGKSQAGSEAWSHSGFYNTSSLTRVPLFFVNYFFISVLRTIKQQRQGCTKIWGQFLFYHLLCQFKTCEIELSFRKWDKLSVF